jgi:homoserine dehydrogenase
MAATVLRVGMFGGGVVGGGVTELVRKYNANGKFAMIGAKIEIVKICVQSMDKARDFQWGNETTFVTDYDSIIKDESINCVVEVMGGVTNAKDVVFSAINAGKHVVTANKALIAAFLPELIDALHQNPTSSYVFFPVFVSFQSLS